jgi:ferric-dicitrate binding protein FerR (iron transport regulator)
MDSRNRNIVYKVVERFFRDQFPKDVEEQVQRWLMDERNSFEKIEATQKLWETININSDKSVYKSLDSVKKKIGLSNPITQKPKIQLQNYIMRVAAVLLPLFAILGTYIYISKQPVTEEAAIVAQQVEIHVPLGEKKQAVLPDSSIVNINSGSTIRYTDPFAEDKRIIELTGEAYFSVKHDSTKPFIVQTKHLDVEVLGTEFDVEAYDEDDNTSVLLDEGKVQVRTSENKLYALDPHQKFVIDNETNEVVIEDVDEEDDNSWTSGELIFRDVRLKDIVKTLERQFAIKIEVADPTVLKKKDIFTIKFRKEDSLENVLEIIELVVGDISFKQIEKNKVLME